MKKVVVLLCSVLVMAVLVACGNGGGSDSGSDGGSGDASAQTVAIEIEDHGIIVLELEPDVAPITVENFVRLAEDGFYDGLTFHRIIEGFMIQGGDPEGTGIGGSDENIKGEFSANGVENDISHVRGVISMARAQDFDSASSQFFIVHQDATFLDGEYAAFGRVVSGMEIVDALAENTPVQDGNGTVLPEDQPVMIRVTVTD
ncbi:MAG: peptidylprolyl isomerase [Lachnospiraceae bacterium]|nr:peptidylprolyl isomerase [Lachnospiraceae bacterium]